MSTTRAANMVLRIGVAFAFLYAAIDGFFSPFDWIDYFPSFLQSSNTLIYLHVFAVVEILIALWILSGYKIFIPSALAGLMLVGIVVFNLQEFQLLFRDLSIAAAALALALGAWQERTRAEV